MPTPNSTVAAIVTVTDQNGNSLSNLSALSLVVTFPDSTVSSTMTLSGGQITNLGSGQYQAKYATKTAGVTVEVWTGTAVDGVTVGQARFEIGVAY